MSQSESGAVELKPLPDEADYEMSASPRTSFLKRAKRDFEYLLQ